MQTNQLTALINSDPGIDRDRLIEILYKIEDVQIVNKSTCAQEEKESIDRLQEEMSVAGCLVKPFDVEELLHSIEKLIK